MKDLLAGISIVIVIVMVFFVFIWGMFQLRISFDRKACESVESTAGIESKYVGYYEGCYVKIDGKFIPQNNWRQQ
jgi:hypothetical protein